jgi:hypothetical protein
MNVYDICSHYPSILQSKSMSFPTGKPIYEKMTQEEFDKLEYYPYGIYRAVMESEVDKRLMTVNPQHHYTHLDLTTAKSLGYTITLIQDNSANVCKYPRRTTGSTLFGQYIQYMYTLKEKHKHPLSKKLLNILWGALCQKRYQYDTTKQGKVEIESLDKSEIFLNNVETDLVVKSEKEYKLPYARIGVFLTAKGRSVISAFIKPIKDTVYRVHTDGFYTTSTISTLSDSLGGLKHEDTNTYEVKNMTKPKVVAC